MEPNLVAALKAKNKEIQDVEEDWKRISVLVEGDKKKYIGAGFFHALPNEKYSERLKRIQHFARGFINPTKSLISAKADYIVRKGIQRDSQVKELKRFIEKADSYGQSLNEFMKTMASPQLAAFGTVFCVVDKPKGIFENRDQELQSGMPYLCILDPLSVHDWEWSESGDLLWFRYRTPAKNLRANPFDPSEKKDDDFVTWTRLEYFRHDSAGKELEKIPHNFGIVPVAIQGSFLINSNKTLGRSSFFDSSDYIILGNNLMSGSNNELFKAFAAILVMNQNDLSDNSILKERDPNTNLRKITGETSEASDVMPVQNINEGMPSYLLKDLGIVEKAKAQGEYYFSLAVDNEKSAKSVQNSDSPQSGIAKAYDFQDLDAVLSNHASELETLEKKILFIVASIMKVNPNFNVAYPREFDVRGFEQKLNEIKELKAVKFPSKTGMIEAYKGLVTEITSDEKLAATISKEIESMEDFEPEVKPLVTSGAPVDSVV